MVPTLVSLCQTMIIGFLEKSNFDGRLINDLCKFVPDSLLEPIFKVLLERGAVTDVALMAFLVPNRLRLRVRQALKIRNSVFKQIGMNCPNLVTLDLCDCAQIRNSVVRAILQGCPLLEDIRLDRCHRLTDAAFDFCESPFQSLLGCLSIEAISLQGCPQITGEIISTLNKHCRRLTYLNLSQCKNVRSPEIQQIFQHGQLRSLNLAFIDDISDEAFVLLPDLSPPRSAYAFSSPIQKLNVCKSRITDSSIFRLAHNLVALLEIRLQWCSGISDKGIAALARSCPRLRLLDLKSCSVTDEGIMSIAEGCSELRVLDLSWCSGFTEQGLLGLLHTYAAAEARVGGVGVGGRQALEQLSLEWCQQITDDTLRALAGLRCLTEVQVAGCAEITAEGVQWLRARSSVEVRV